MGNIRQFTCPACQQTWRVRVGQGLLHGTMKNVLKAFPADLQQKILADLKNDPGLLFQFQYRAAKCPRCRKITAVPLLELTQTGKQYTTGCPECGGAVSPQEEGTALTCPGCEKAKLAEQNAGLWD